MEEVKKLDETNGPHHSVSLTGGEPLLYADFLGGLLPELKKRRLKRYLETNGTLPEELKRVIGYIDIIAMDIKLPSSTDMPPFWRNHVEFLNIARGKAIFAKVVVTDNTSESDIIEAANIIENFDKEMLFVLQPVSPTENGDFTADKEKMIHCCRLSEERLRNVIVIPQMHKFVGVR